MHLTAELTADYPRVLVLTYNEIRAKELYEDAQAFLGAPPSLYPARDLLFWGADVAGSLLARERMRVLKTLLEEKTAFVVTTADALLDRLSSPAFLRKNVVRLKTGGVHDLSELTKQLVELGFVRTEVVDMPGEFAVRGGILDLYPLTEESPIRVEFWDDEIESIEELDADILYTGLDIVFVNLLRTLAEVPYRVSVTGNYEYRKILRYLLVSLLGAVEDNSGEQRLWKLSDLY